MGDPALIAMVIVIYASVHLLSARIMPYTREHSRRLLPDPAGLAHAGTGSTQPLSHERRTLLGHAVTWDGQLG